MLTRREFLEKALLATGIVFIPSIVNAEDNSGKFDISYIWHKDLEAILDYQRDVEGALGEDSRRLEIVKGKSGKYGLIYDFDGNKNDAIKLAIKQRRKLVTNGLDAAVIISDTGYNQLYNVTYGVGPNLERLKQDFVTVNNMLGDGVGKELFIEQRPDNQYALVYRRRGDKQPTLEAAQRHDGLLASKGIHASITRENNNDVVYGESSEIEEKEPTIVKKKTKEKPTHALEQKVKEHISYLRKKGKLSNDETIAISVYDLSSDQKLVSINEEIPLECASMVKPFVALAFFHKVHEGHLKYTSDDKKNMEKMIQRSSNHSTNELFDRVGGFSEVNRILHSNYGNIFKQTKVVEKIPEGGQTYKNKASAHDYSRFLYTLTEDKLPSSREIKRLMALPKRDRVYTGVPNIPSGTLVYGKTGTTGKLCGDMAVLAPLDKEGNRHYYTVIGIIEKEKKTNSYGHWEHSRGNIIREVSGMAYDFLTQKYSFK